MIAISTQTGLESYTLPPFVIRPTEPNNFYAQVLCSAAGDGLRVTINYYNSQGLLLTPTSFTLTAAVMLSLTEMAVTSIAVPTNAVLAVVTLDRPAVANSNIWTVTNVAFGPGMSSQNTPGFIDGQQRANLQHIMTFDARSTSTSAMTFDVPLPSTTRGQYYDIAITWERNSAATQGCRRVYLTTQSGAVNLGPTNIHADAGVAIYGTVGYSISGSNLRITITPAAATTTYWGITVVRAGPQ